MWRGGQTTSFTITIPDGVKVLKITTENSYVNNFVQPPLPIYVGVTPGIVYNMRWAYVSEGAIPEPEYFDVWVQRYNSNGDWKTWVSSYNGEDPEGSGFTYIDVIISYSASINEITPSVTDYR